MELQTKTTSRWISQPLDMEELLVSDVISTGKIRQIVNETLISHNDLCIYLFGSYAKGKANRSSDIDLLLSFSNKNNLEHIAEIKNILHAAFLKHSKFCQPIHGYRERLDQDSHILLRQYIHYGKRVYGDSVKYLLPDETEKELLLLEYSRFWKPMAKKKLEELKLLVAETDYKYYGDLGWQYLYLALYWSAKAALTLECRQHSLNEYSLEYIYATLIGVVLSPEEIEALTTVQKSRKAFIKGEFLPDDDSFEECYAVLGTLVNRVPNGPRDRIQFCKNDMPDVRILDCSVK